MGVKVIGCSRILSRLGEPFKAEREQISPPCARLGAVSRHGHLPSVSGMSGWFLGNQWRTREFGNKEGSGTLHTPVSREAAHLPSERERMPPVLPGTNLTTVFSPYFHINTIFVLLNCLDLRNTLFCCTILSVLHVLVPSLFFSSDVWKFSGILFLQAGGLFQPPGLF